MQKSVATSTTAAVVANIAQQAAYIAFRNNDATNDIRVSLDSGGNIQPVSTPTSTVGLLIPHGGLTIFVPKTPGSKIGSGQVNAIAVAGTPTLEISTSDPYSS